MRKNLLSSLLLSIFIVLSISYCKRETASIPDDPLTNLSQQLLQNEDFKEVVILLPALRQELMAIQEGFAAKKADRKAPLTAAENLAISQQFQNGKLFTTFTQHQKAVREQFAQLKELKDADLRKVYLKAMKAVKAGSRQSAEANATLWINPECEDSCKYAKDYEYELADIEYYKAINVCEDDYWPCWQICTTFAPGPARNMCMNTCLTTRNNCMAAADAAWVAQQAGILAEINNCIQLYCHED